MFIIHKMCYTVIKANMLIKIQSVEQRVVCSYGLHHAPPVSVMINEMVKDFGLLMIGLIDELCLL